MNNQDDDSPNAGRSREMLASLICERDETIRLEGVTRLSGHRYVFGTNGRGEALCLVWPGDGEGGVTRTDLQGLALEVRELSLALPYHVYAAACRFSETEGFKFRQLSTDLLAEFDLLRLADDYEAALNRGDFTRVGEVLGMAEGNARLDELIAEVNERIAREENIAVTPEELARTLEMVHRTFEEAGVPSS